MDMAHCWPLCLVIFRSYYCHIPLLLSLSDSLHSVSSERASMPGQVRDISKHQPPLERRPILVPVDFSSCSEAALLFAAHLAGSSQTPLLVLHVVHEPASEPGFYRRARRTETALTRPLEDVARDMLNDFIAELDAEGSAREALASASTRLVSGLPAQRIEEVALDEDAALIVMGSHGRNAFSLLAAGSVAAEVARRSQIPLTVVKSPSPQRRRLRDKIFGSSEWWTRHIPLRVVNPID
jgi:nucleotide-binding universal stress UspA family protein